MADIKAVHNSMSLGAAPQQQPKVPVAPEHDPAKDAIESASRWDGIERRSGPYDRRAENERKRPDFLETRHRKDRRRRRSVSVKV